jgi:cobalt/nickel transport system ATP-binding protein
MPVIHRSEQQNTLNQSGIEQLNEILVSINNLDYQYPDGHTALRDVSITIRYDEKVALVGPNGAGKSTLMLHLNGILKGNGDVRIDNLKIDKNNIALIRSKVGMVFQNPDDQLFSPTVFEDVAYGPLYMGMPEEDVRAAVQKALEMVDMNGFGERLSHHLSAGEKKRIAIATVLSMTPQILVLDEPSSGLDPRARRTLINLLGSLPLTMLVSTHDLHMVRDLFPRTIILDNGRVVADGSTKMLLQDEKLLKEHGLEMP